MLNAIGGGVDASVLGKLALGPAQFNGGLHRMAVMVHDTAVKPAAAALTSVVFTLELARTSVRADGDRALGVRIIGAVLLKCALVMLFASHARLVLDGIDGVVAAIVGRVDGVVSDPSGPVGEPLGDRMRPAIEDAGVVGQSGLMILVLIPFLIAQVASLALTVVVWMRFMQVYLLSCFASLPVVFLACDETRSMGAGYLRRYAQAGFQSVTLMVGVALYRGFIADAVRPDGFVDGSNLWQWTVANFGSLMLGSVMLVCMVVLSSSASRAVLGG